MSPDEGNLEKLFEASAKGLPGALEALAVALEAERLRTLAEQAKGPPPATFLPAAVRPAGYPPELPFLPNATAVIRLSTSDGSAEIEWSGVPDAEAAASHIIAEWAAAGWQRMPSFPKGVMRGACLMREGMTRVMLWGSEQPSTIHLMEARLF